MMLKCQKWLEMVEWVRNDRMTMEWWNDIRMTWMLKEWTGMLGWDLNQVLSLLNRQHLIHSFRGHSAHSWIIQQFKGQANGNFLYCPRMRSQWGMIPKWMEWSYDAYDFDKEWPNDGETREIFELRVLPCFKNIPHFTLIISFQQHPRMMRVKGME